MNVAVKISNGLVVNFLMTTESTIPQNYDELWTSNQWEDYINNFQQTIDNVEVEKRKLRKNIEFGNELIETFLLDNRLDPTITTAQSLVLLAKFKDVSDLARLGDIKKVYYLTELIETDEVFTIARKSKYLNMIGIHIMENY